LISLVADKSSCIALGSRDLESSLWLFDTVLETGRKAAVGVACIACMRQYSSALQKKDARYLWFNTKLNVIDLMTGVTFLG
jgi:hypothetical protein